MTDIEPASGGALATVDPDAVEGLEDFDNATDAQMPMLKIKHDSGQFVDALSDETLNEPGQPLEVILLGLIKQRVLWAAEVSDDAKPLCKSYNFTEGVPDEATFPVKSTQFSRDDLEGKLPCEKCPLKEWGSHPKNDTPWCTEQHTFALLVKSGDGWSPALLTVQRSAIKPSKQYLTSFARAKDPLYTVVTSISLDQRRRGTVDFSVPKFSRGEATDEALWPSYAQTYRGIREFVQTPRTRDDEDGDDEDVDDAPVAEPVKKAAPAKKAAPPKAAEPEPEEEEEEAEAAAPEPEAEAEPEVAADGDDDDDLPF